MSSSDVPELELAWLRCLVKAGLKEGEVFVKVEAEGVPGPLGFYVDHSLVRPGKLSPEEESGEVHVFVLGRDNGSTSVQVPGEPVSFGPKILVSSTLVA